MLNRRRALLAELVRLFYQGMTAPLPLLPETALAGVELALAVVSGSMTKKSHFYKMADTFNDKNARQEW